MYKKLAKIVTLSAFLATATGVNAQQQQLSIQQSIQELANSQSGAIRQLNASFPSRLPSNMMLSRSQILDFYQRGVNGMRVDISQFKSGNINGVGVASSSTLSNSSNMDINRSDIDSSGINNNGINSSSNSSNLDQNLATSQSSSMDQGRDFTQDESNTGSADIQEPNTLKNTSDKSSTADNQQYGDHDVNGNLNSNERVFTEDSNKSIDNSMDNSSMDNSAATTSTESNTVRQDFTLQPKTDQQASDIDQNNIDNSNVNTNTNTSSDQTQRVRLSKD